MLTSGLGVTIVLLSALLAPRLAAAQAPPGPPATPNDPTPVATIPIVIDLAGDMSQKVRVDAGTYRLVLMNAVVGRDYWLHVGPSIAMQITPLPADVLKAERLTRAESRSMCGVTEAARSVAEAATESAVRQQAEGLRIKLGGADPTTCSEEIAYGESVMSATQRVIDTPVVIAADVVRRVAISSRAGANWTVSLASTGRGLWQTTYGFSVGPNHDDEYFSEATGESQFTIRRKPRDAGSLTLLPTVFFTWLSSSQAFKDIQHGPTVGVGITTGSPGGRFGVLGGYGVRFNQNIGVVAGVSIYPHRRLDGQYEEEQVVKENLSSDQLNADSIRANVFVAFTLRFGSSPFAGSGDE